MGKLAGLLMIVAAVGTAAHVYPILNSGEAPVESALPNAKQIEIPQSQVAKRSARIDEEENLALTREIQRELRRVGCYEGTADGAWDAETRQAIKTFLDRVNAILPIDTPDHILKTLVQGQPGNACGKSCPSGQAMSGDRCVPSAIIAQGAPKRTAPQRDAAVGAPKPPATHGWRTQIAPAPQVAMAPEPKSEPLAGRMSVGSADVPAGPSSTVVAQDPAGVSKAKIEQLPRVQPMPGATDDDDVSLQRVQPRRVPLEEVYRIPPPRVVSSSAQPVFRERQKFGPEFFKDVERSGR